MQAKLTRRFAQGSSVVAGYTVSKNLEEVSFLNNQDFNLAKPESSRLERRLASRLDTPQRFTLGGYWTLPVGRGARFLSDLPAWADPFLGSWQVNGFTEVFSGYPVEHPGGPKTVERSAQLPAGERTLLRWFDNTIFTTQAPNTLRTYPTIFPDVRFPTRCDVSFSIFKDFKIAERLKAEYRAEIINVLNHPWFVGLATTSPTATNLGQLDLRQQNLPRTIHMQLKLVF